MNNSKERRRRRGRCRDTRRIAAVIAGTKSRFEAVSVGTAATTATVAVATGSTDVVSVIETIRRRAATIWKVAVAAATTTFR